MCLHNSTNSSVCMDTNHQNRSLIRMKVLRVIRKVLMWCGPFGKKFHPQRWYLCRFLSPAASMNTFAPIVSSWFSLNHFWVSEMCLSASCQHYAFPPLQRAVAFFGQTANVAGVKQKWTAADSTFFLESWRGLRTVERLDSRGETKHQVVQTTLWKSWRNLELTKWK